MVKKIVFLLFIFCLLPLVSADIFQPDLTQSLNDGYIIDYPLQESYQQGEKIDFHYKVYRIDNGTLVNSGIDCYLFLYDDNGTEILFLQDNTSDGFSYEFTVLGGNFTRVGGYTGVSQCNSSSLGGFQSFDIMVTPSGNSFDIPQAILYSFFMILLVGLFLLTTWGALTLPWGNERNREGEVIKVNWKKYLKMFSACWAYVTLIWIVFMGWTLSWAYLQWQGLGTIFKLSFYILMGTALPIFIGIILLFLISFLSDAKIQAGINKFTKGIQ